jgi:hypothetical protein
MSFSFYEIWFRIIRACGRQSKPCPPLAAICLCQRGFSFMVGLIFDVPVG